MSKSHDKKKTLTNSNGSPIGNDSNSLTVGAEGPVLLQDIQLVDKLAAFDRERIPERVVHAKGAGAHGYFTTYRSMEKYTCAKFLEDDKKKTDVFVRFSTVIGSKGSADTARDPRGFAVKFYTEDGNYDIVGNNIPVFFINDAIKFPDVIHSLKPDPVTNLVINERFWDFVSRTPEATHMITWLFSDFGTVKSYRTMPGNSVNTYVWINKKNERFFVRYQFEPVLGQKNICAQEAELLAGLEPDVAVKDLYETIARGECVEYEVLVQIIPCDEACKFNFDILDATKLWPEKLVPYTKVGKLTLNRNPDNFFLDVEQSAFAPSNLVPGIEPSNDKLLQGRLFSYKDTQRHRLGANFMQLPTNKPKVEVVNNEVDGPMRMHANKSSINYYPSNYTNKKEDSSYDIKGPYTDGTIERNTIHKIDHFSQAGDRYRSLCSSEKEALIDNIVCNMWGINKNIQEIVVKYFYNACEDFGERVARKLYLK